MTFNISETIQDRAVERQQVSYSRHRHCYHYQINP